MRVQAEASLYPLRTEGLTGPIDAFVRHLRGGGLSVEIGPMSSRLAGECPDMFRALGEAFEAAAREGDVVVAVRVTNACPGVGGTSPGGPEARQTPSADGT